METFCRLVVSDLYYHSVGRISPFSVGDYGIIYSENLSEDKEETDIYCTGTEVMRFQNYFFCLLWHE